MTRLPALDALRAAMMLLGIVLHSAINFLATPILDVWPYNDRSTSPLFDIAVFFIHLFRMPTFFVMAGFFAAFLYARDGAPGFLQHRMRRVLLPLVVAWILLFPLVKSGFVFAAAGGGSAGWAAVEVSLGTAPYAEPALAHLWFLYYLFIFCLAAVVVVPIVRRLPADARARLSHLAGRYAAEPAGCLALGAITAITLLPMDKPGIDTAFAFVPAVRVLVTYAVFFAFGWVLFHQRAGLETYGRRPWRYLGAGVVTSGVYLTLLVARPVADARLAHAVAVVVAGFATWLLIFAVMGLFIRYAATPRPLQRYLADASYWMYLVHLPCTIWIPGLLAPWSGPAFVKFAVVLSGTTLVTLVTYHLGVRTTAVGTFLNGRRASARSMIGATDQAGSSAR